MSNSNTTRSIARDENNNIFRKRKNVKPYEYPEFLEYTDAIRNSYWVHTEFNFSGDVQDFKVDTNPVERSVIRKTMLAIAQIEVEVKTFWAEIYQQMPKEEIGSVGMTFAECHKEGTEVLTPTGWKDFRTVSKGDIVIQFNEDGTLSPVKTQATTKKQFDGELINVYKTGLDARITPNHDLAYYDHNDELQKQSVEELGVRNTNNDLPEAGKLQGEIDNLSDEDRLKIAIQADGSARYYRNNDGERVRRGLSKNKHTYEITVKKERKKDRLMGLLNSLDIEYREFDELREGYRKFEIDLNQNVDFKTFDWVDLEDKSHHWCEEFIQELAEWDGTRLPDKEDCKIKYITTSKANADVVQMVGVGAGYRTNLGTYEDDRKESYKDTYTISFTANREKTSFSPLKTTKEEYTGNVYCVTVPSGMLVTRYNNTTFISGNSEVRHMDAYSHLLDVLGLADEFEKITDVPAIAGRIEYLEKYLEGANSEDKEEYVMSLLLFSIFIEHVSLFSQFLIMTSFDKYEKKFKGISNAVEATSKEEQIHGLFGVELVNTIQEENPDLFGDDFDARVQRACNKAYNAEMKILDWIFSEGELDFLPREHIDEFLKNRFNTSMEKVGVDSVFETDADLLEETRWFDEDIMMTKHNDFFSKRSTTYNKHTQSVTAEDMF